MSTRAPKVFVTQIPSRRDPATNEWIPTVNVTSAQKFGEVMTLLPPGSAFFAASETTRLIKQRLHDLDYQMGDYLLPLGHPAIMAVTAAVAARRSNGCLRVLVWDKHSKDYVPFELDNLV